MSKSNRDNSQAAFQARRAMLKLGTCGAMTNTTFLSTLLHLKATSAVMAQQTIGPFSDYKALVCLFFNGAIDSFNVLAPYGTAQNDAEYAGYVNIRTQAALKRNAAWDGALNNANPALATDGYLLPITDGNTGKVYGLHHRFPNLQYIYNQGHATFSMNTGVLVQPIANNTEYGQASKIKPIGLYSHPDQQRHWQTAVPTSRNQVQGWAGKMMDLMTDDATAAAASNVYTSISLAGQTILLTGNRITPYAISAVNANNTGGAVLLQGYSATGTPGNPYDRIYSKTQNDQSAQIYADILERSIRNERNLSRDAAAAFQAAYSTVTLPATSVPFGTNNLGAQLASVARAIKVAQSTTAPLQQKRQVFLVQIGGWDHHASLLTNQNTMIPGIDNGIRAFYDFLIAEGLLSNVTLFTISDFARTLSFNGSGSDHAWGGNPFVVGGAVNGGRLYGTYPNFVSSNSANSVNTGGNGLDRGRGVLIPTTSTDVYHREICRWFGVPSTYMDDLLPNIGNFSSTPLGFMA